MALPKLKTPIYTLDLPSTGEKVKYRPFLVKEQKILMMAQESENETEIFDAVTTLVNSCTFDKIDCKKSPLFDIEYIFLKIRSKSVWETVNLNVICPDDQKTQVPVTINLDEKKLGLAAKERLIQLCGEELQLLSLGKGKYGRILGIPHTKEGKDICQILIREGHAVEYWGGKKVKVWA